MIKKIHIKRVTLIFFLLFITEAVFSQHHVKGLVTSDEDVPLPFVTVTVKGTSQGTVTDLDGQYSIELTDKDVTLVYSYVGYKTKEIPFEGQTVLDVSLDQDLQTLESVVVVGYGTQKKSDITGSVAKVEAEELTKMPIANIDQALQGRASGVLITESSGAPGSPLNVQIRGVGSINKTDPLYIVDGVQLNQINAINPSDIESIEILKDASACAIYGNKGANGVILISTKKGTHGEKPAAISFESYYGWQQINKYIDVMDTEEYSAYIRELYYNTGEEIPGDFINNENIANTDWQDELYRIAPRQNYYLSVSGGSKNGSYSISGGYTGQDGIMRGTDFERLSFRVNSNLKKNKLEIGENLSVSLTDRNSAYQDGGYSPTAFATLLPPTIPLRCDTCVGGWQGPTPELAGNNTRPNVVGMNEYFDQINQGQQVIANLYVQYEFIDGLKFKINLGGTINNSYSGDYYPMLDMGISKYTNLTYGEKSRNSRQGYYWFIDNLLSYSRKINEHDFEILAGYVSESHYNQGFNLNTSGFALENAQPIGEAERIINHGGNENLGKRSIGYLSRLNYSYKNKYLLTTNIRYDGTNQFDTDYRWGAFPSFSVGWKIHNEEFFRNSNIANYFDFLKGRFGWGITGNAETGLSFRYLSKLGFATRTAIGNPQRLLEGYASWNSPNDAMQWETVHQSNIGLELGMFNNKLFIVSDYYIKRTKDMLLEVPNPFYAGIWREFPMKNTGEVLNKGLEMEIDWKSVVGKIDYSLSANFTTISNEVISTGERSEPIYGPSVDGELVTKTEKGSEIGQYYGYIMEGIFQTDAEVESYNAIAIETTGNPDAVYQSKQTVGGDIKFKDINGDGLINDDDRTFIGSPIPDFIFGASGNISYLGFDFSFFLQGVTGNEILNIHKRDLYNTHSSDNKSPDVLNRWSEDNPNDEIPRIINADPNYNQRISSRWVEDGSFLKLRNVQLGYSLPESMLHKAGLGRLRIYVAASNLYTFSNYSGYDPEIGTTTGYSTDHIPNLEKGIDYGYYPRSRTYQIGVQIEL